MRKHIPRPLLVLLAWSVFFFAGPGLSFAHGPAGTLSERGYEQMRNYAHELDSAARHANDQAQHQEYWVYGNDAWFLRAVARFAERAHRFHGRMDAYQSRPWQVDDELRGLIHDARDVQHRVQRARYADEHTIEDWNNVTQLLNRMVFVYRADVAGRAWDNGDEGPWHRPGERPPQGRGYDDGQLVALARELHGRATQARLAAERLSPIDTLRADPYLDAIGHFEDRARDFRERVEARQGNPDEIGSEARRLYENARRVNDDMRQHNAYPEIWRDWQAVIQTAERILQASRG